MNRFDRFTDGELYMLKRQAIESSYNIVMTGKYNKQQIKHHDKLMNEIVAECSRRECQDQIDQDYREHY